MFERYTHRARRAIYFARAEALVRGAQCIATQDLFLGLTYDPHAQDCPFRDLYDKRTEWRALLQAGPAPTRKLNERTRIPLSPQSKITLRHCAAEADFDGRRAIDREHLLRALLLNDDEVASSLHRAGFTLEQARKDSERCQQTSQDLKLADLLREWIRFRQRQLMVGALAGLLGALAVLYLHSQN